MRVVVMVVAGVGAALLTGVMGSWSAAPVVGWVIAAAIYNVWVWLVIGRLGPADTASHAVREDPSRATSDLLVVIAAIASLGAVALVLIQAKGASDAMRALFASLALAGVVLSWVLVHTLFTLRYARLYYRDGGGISFNQDAPPQYTDFAYLAFDIGMTYQVADTNIETHVIRAATLRHMLLSYVFGAVILATTINLVIGLAG